MGLLRPIVQFPVRRVIDAGHDLPHRRTELQRCLSVAAFGPSPSRAAQQPVCRFGIATTSHQNFQHKNHPDRQHARASPSCRGPERRPRRGATYHSTDRPSSGAFCDATCTRLRRSSLDARDILPSAKPADVAMKAKIRQPGTPQRDSAFNQRALIARPRDEDIDRV